MILLPSSLTQLFLIFSHFVLVFSILSASSPISFPRTSRYSETSIAMTGLKSSQAVSFTRAFAAAGAVGKVTMVSLSAPQCLTSFASGKYARNLASTSALKVSLTSLSKIILRSANCWVVGPSSTAKFTFLLLTSKFFNTSVIKVHLMDISLYFRSSSPVNFASAASDSKVRRMPCSLPLSVSSALLVNTCFAETMPSNWDSRPTKNSWISSSLGRPIFVTMRQRPSASMGMQL